MRYAFFPATIFLAKAALAEPLILTTESYPPYTFLEDGKARGIGIEQIDLIMENSGQDYRIEMMPWARAMALAQSQPMHCVFAAARTPEREPLFKWVEPMLLDSSLLVTWTGSGIRPATLEEAKRYTVGTHRNDYTDTLLRSMGFPKIDLAPDFNLSVRKLLSRRIDLMPMSENAFRELKAGGAEIESVLPFAEQRLGLACHRSVPDALIGRMQANLDTIIEDGRQGAIYRKYGVQPP